MLYSECRKRIALRVEKVEKVNDFHMIVSPFGVGREISVNSL